MSNLCIRFLKNRTQQKKVIQCLSWKICRKSRFEGIDFQVKKGFHSRQGKKLLPTSKLICAYKQLELHILTDPQKFQLL